MASSFVGDIGSVRGSDALRRAHRDWSGRRESTSQYLFAVGIVPMQLLHFSPERASLLAKGVAFSVVMVPVQIFAGQTGLDLHATKQGASPHPQKRR